MAPRVWSSFSDFGPVYVVVSVRMSSGGHRRSCSLGLHAYLCVYVSPFLRCLSQSTTIAMQYLACVCSIIACLTQNEEIDQLSECINLIADCMYCSVCACMQAQHKRQLDERDANPNIVVGTLAPPVDMMFAPQQQGQMGGHPQQQGAIGYPAQQQGGYPPQQGGYPPQQGGYPPQQGGYPPQQGGYPPQQQGYPQQQYQQQYPPPGGYPQK